MPDMTAIIYVVSETAALALSIQKSLGGPDFFVQIFSDPMQAIKTTISTPPTAVISDFQFNGLMGLEVLQQIKIKYPDMKSVLLVNNETHPDVKKARELGAAILAKPVDAKKLKEFLKSTGGTDLNQPSGQRNIMMIEKNSNIRFTIKKCFAGKKVEITEIANPFELIEKYYLKKWDFIFFDIDNDFMPEDDFIRTVIDNKWPPSLFILLSTSWNLQRMNKFMSKQFQRFISIPMKPEEVQKMVDTMMGNGH